MDAPIPIGISVTQPLITKRHIHSGLQIRDSETGGWNNPFYLNSLIYPQKAANPRS